MSEGPSSERREYDLTMHVFAIGDELLAADAVVFMVCCFLSFWSFKTKTIRLRQVLRLIIDVFFMLALTIMVVVCAVIAYAVA